MSKALAKLDVSSGDLKELYGVSSAASLGLKPYKAPCVGEDPLFDPSESLERLESLRAEYERSLQAEEGFVRRLFSAYANIPANAGFYPAILWACMALDSHREGHMYGFEEYMATAFAFAGLGCLATIRDSVQSANKERKAKNSESVSDVGQDEAQRPIPLGPPSQDVAG